MTHHSYLGLGFLFNSNGKDLGFNVHKHLQNVTMYSQTAPKSFGTGHLINWNDENIDKSINKGNENNIRNFDTVPDLPNDVLIENDDLEMLSTLKPSNRSNHSNHFNLSSNSIHERALRRISVLCWHLLASDTLNLENIQNSNPSQSCNHVSLEQCNEACFQHLDNRHAQLFLSFQRYRMHLNNENRFSHANLPNTGRGSCGSASDSRCKSCKNALHVQWKWSVSDLLQLFSSLANVYIPWEKFLIVRPMQGEKHVIIDFLQHVQNRTFISNPVTRSQYDERGIILQLLCFSMLTRHEKAHFINYLSKYEDQFVKHPEKWDLYLQEMVKSGRQLLVSNPEFLTSKCTQRELPFDVNQVNQLNQMHVYHENMNSYRTFKTSAESNVTYETPTDWLQILTKRRWYYHNYDRFRGIHLQEMGLESSFVDENEFHASRCTPKHIHTWNLPIMNEGCCHRQHMLSTVEHVFPSTVRASRIKQSFAPRKRNSKSSMPPIVNIIERMLNRELNRELNRRQNPNTTHKAIKILSIDHDARYCQLLQNILQYLRDDTHH